MRYNIWTGKQILCTKLCLKKLPDVSSIPLNNNFDNNTIIYKFRIIQNKQMDAATCIAFLHNELNEHIKQKWPFALSKIIQTYYCIDYLHIINNNKDRFSKFYLYSWVLPIDGLFLN